MTALIVAAFLAALPSPAFGHSAAAMAAAAWQERSAEALYKEGTAALDREEWDRAAEAFGEAAALGGSRADAALYWRAYALNKRGRRDEALETLARLRREHPKSRWIRDARALEIEVRGATGQGANPEGFEEDELKLLALSSLMNTAPERAIPMAEQMLSKGSEKVRDRALFVLAQSGSPEARETLVRLARSSQDPDIRVRAIRYLGLFGGQENRQVLVEIYGANTDERARREVLHAFMVAGDRARLTELARTEPNPELRKEAIHQLGVAGGRKELWQLYQQESSADVKHHIINALFVGGALDELTQLATKETNPELRKDAIQRLGLTGEARSSETLSAIYASDKDPEVRKAVLNAFFIQGNASALVAIAKKETDPGMKREAVRFLSLMNSKEATDYMLELLQ